MAIKKSDSMCCEASFANNIAWQRLNNTKALRYKDYCLLRSEDNGVYYYDFPFGLNKNSSLEECREVIEIIKSDAKANNMPLIITTVTKDLLYIFEELYPEQYSIETSSAHDDYIYLAQDLIELKGKKYHKKRNHIANFKKFNWRYVPINSSNIDDALVFAVDIYNETLNDGTVSFVSEQFAINTYFTYFEQLELCGGLLYVDDKIVALTIGEMLNSDTFVVHIEKADREYNGAYPTICNEFLKNYAQNAKYVNREEDLGLDGLRKSKQSFYPCFMLEKYTLTFNMED